MTEDEIKIQNSIAVGRMALRVARDKRTWDGRDVDYARRRLIAALAETAEIKDHGA